MMFSCAICQKTFTQGKSLKRHEKEQHDQRSAFKCEICDKSFLRLSDFNKHKESHAGLLGLNAEHVCGQCSKHFHIRSDLDSHNCSSANIDTGLDVGVEYDEAIESTDVCDLFENISAINGRVGCYKYRPNRDFTDLNKFLQLVRPKLRFEILRVMKDGRRAVKWYVAVAVKFVRVMDSDLGGDRYTTTIFHGLCRVTLTSKDSVNLKLNQSFAHILNRCESFLHLGSGWVIETVERLDLNILMYTPLYGSSYIELPPILKAKKAIVNVRNIDNRCFIYSILASLHSEIVNNSNRVSSYEPFLNDLNTKGFSFPMEISQISRFEELNDLSINVFGYEDSEVIPLIISKNSVAKEREVDLLLISDDSKKHYCSIRSFSRLLGSLTKHKCQAFYCRRCLHRFRDSVTLENHLVSCSEHGAQKIEMPEVGKNILKFDGHHYAFETPYIIYADFECMIPKISSCKPDPSSSSTTKIGKHVPSGFCYIVVDYNGAPYKGPVHYRGADAAETFLDSLMEIEDEMLGIISTNKPMIISEIEEESFKHATTCHICNKPLINRVRDHDHMTGRYRGPACNVCNLNFRASKAIPVVFHNLRNYDSHILMSSVGKYKDRKLFCIANNAEQYVSFTIGGYKFIDSLQFMPSSLDSLVNNLSKTGSQNFKILSSCIPLDKISLLTRKGVFPYDYIDREDRFLESSLPPIEAFFNSLTGESLSQEDYDFAKTIWESFEIKNLGEYQDLYNKTDVLLLADVFQNFREVCRKHYGLDPGGHFLTSPGLAWQACLKKSGVELELFTDIDMHLLCEEGIRGGISMISHRFAKANNPYLEEYNPAEPTTYIMYLDANNLYGWAMSQPMPTGSFRWLNDQEISRIDFLRVDSHSAKGYMLKVDLEYPPSLHDSHSDYPLAPENVTITADMLSPYSTELLKTLGLKHSPNIKKLLPNLNDKSGYVIHYRNLQLYVALGMRLTKIHVAIEFQQSPWMKSYIDFNTDQRKLAKNEFEKSFFKLMNNSVFGKTMENLRSRSNVELIHTEKRLTKVVASPSFKSVNVFNEDLVAVSSYRKKLLLNRPIYVGFCILELSKFLMYDFHYNHIRVQYGDKATLLLTDTDSLTYRIETDDVYKDMQFHSNLFDTSDMPETHFLYSESNKKKLGKMKDEALGEPISELVALRPKLYSFKLNGKDTKRAKGVSKSVVKHIFNHETYRNCLFKKEIKRVEMVKIQSYQHDLYTIRQNKCGMTAADDKRYILPDGVKTLAHGHYKIKENAMDVD